MTDLPSFHTYCRNTTPSNALCFDLGQLTVWFSYHTPVAFRGNGHSLTVHENVWGPTTGKHLNAIDGGYRAARVSGEEFDKRLQEALS